MEPSTPVSSAEPLQRPRTSFLRTLGPGLITGAADDDPSGIATYSQVGAQFGYSLAWTIPFSYPLLAVTQGISAGIGAVTGQGIAQNLRRHYSPWVLRFAVLLLLTANVINLGADLGAMGAALELLIGGAHHLYAVLFALICVFLEIFISYQRYVKVLKWLTLSLLAYVAVVLSVHVPWGEALYGVLVPQIAFDSDHAMALIAVLGTTISPYLFFWQAGRRSKSSIGNTGYAWVQTLTPPGRSLHAFGAIPCSGWVFPTLWPWSSSLPPRRRLMPMG